jgi:hypothetical protein
MCRHGNLIIRGSADYTTTKLRRRRHGCFNEDGAVNLYHDNALKLATTATGIDVTGTVVADGLTVENATGSATPVPSTITLSTTTSASDWSTTLPWAKLAFDSDDTSSAGPKTHASIETISEEAGGALSSLYLKTHDGTSLKARAAFAGNGDISFYEDTGTTAKLTWDASAESLNFADNAKAIFGAGSDLQIYHDGNHSYISDQGTGNLRVLAANFQVRNAADSAGMITAADGGAVYLFHDGDQKLVTTATGIDVTGDVVADGLTVAGAALVDIDVDTETAALTLKGSSFADGEQITLDFTRGSVVLGQLSVEVAGTGTAGIVRLGTASGSVNYDRLMIADNGDISFYEDTGTTPKFFWDASAESLGIGTSSPANALHIYGSQPLIRLEDTDSGGAYVNLSANTTTGSLIIDVDPNNVTSGSYFRVDTDNGERLSIDSTATVFNEPGNDVDFRIESDTRSSAFFLDGATGFIGLNTLTPDTAVDILGSIGNGPVYTASISGTTMTVTAVSSGTIEVGQLVFGANVETGTRIIATISGDGGEGTYVVSVAQDAASGTTYSSSNTYGTNILRITSSDTSVSAGQPDGMIQFYGSDISPPGVGVTSYIASINEDGTPDTALVFGTRSQTGDGIDANERVRITSTGNVGIGTRSPSTPLEIKKLSDATIRLNYGEITSNDAEDYYGGVEFYAEGSNFGRPDVSAYMRAIHTRAGTDHGNADAGLIFGTSTSTSNATAVERMRIQANTGYVGIGTDSPSQLLEVRGAAAKIRITDTDTSGTTGIEFVDSANTVDAEIEVGNSTQYFAIKTAGSEAMRIDSSGNVGIGTESPANYRLHVEGEDDLGAVYIHGGAGTSWGLEIGSHTQTTESDLVFTSNAVIGTQSSLSSVVEGTGYFAWCTGGTSHKTGTAGSTERVRIDADGLKFNGDTASTNALDDYEEGTWTPVIADATTGGNTGSATINYAMYTKVGRQVTVAATLTDIVRSTLTTSSVFHVRGLPFTSGTQQTTGSVRTDLITFQGGRTMVTPNVGPSDSWVTFLVSGSGLVDTPIDCGDLTSTTADMSFTITYFV